MKTCSSCGRELSLFARLTNQKLCRACARAARARQEALEEAAPRRRSGALAAYRKSGETLIREAQNPDEILPKLASLSASGDLRPEDVASLNDDIFVRYAEALLQDIGRWSSWVDTEACDSAN